MIPVFVILLLLTPALVFFSEQPKQRWRMRYFFGLNGVLLLLTSFTIPQSNVVFLADYLQKHPEIAKMTLSSEIAFFPSVYVNRPLLIERAEPSQEKAIECGTVVVFLEALHSELSPKLGTKVACFAPGPSGSTGREDQPRTKQAPGNALRLRVCAVTAVYFFQECGKIDL